MWRKHKIVHQRFTDCSQLNCRCTQRMGTDSSQQTRNVANAGPTLIQYCVNVSCLLRSRWFVGLRHCHMLTSRRLTVEQFNRYHTIQHMSYNSTYIIQFTDIIQFNRYHTIQHISYNSTDIIQFNRYHTIQQISYNSTYIIQFNRYHTIQQISYNSCDESIKLYTRGSQTVHNLTAVVHSEWALTHPSKHETSQTLAQHWSNIVSTSRVCWDLVDSLAWDTVTCWQADAWQLNSVCDTIQADGIPVRGGPRGDLDIVRIRRGRRICEEIRYKLLTSYMSREWHGEGWWRVKPKRQYLNSSQVRRHCLLALQSSYGRS